MSNQTIPKIEVIDLGLMPYREALKRQEEAHEKVKNGHDAVVFIVEHPAVLTFGKNSDRSHLLFSDNFYESIGVELVEIERGGQVTAHMPGQLVLYPILPINHLGISVRSYVDLLEETIIRVLSEFGLTSSRDSQYPGVWIKGQSKIAAIGVRIKERVSMHGLALNVNNSLDLFGQIVPCGIKFRSVTSMKQELSAELDIKKVKESLLRNFFLLFEKI